MFQASVPEKVTGHRSLKALRTHECVSLDQRGYSLVMMQIQATSINVLENDKASEAKA